MTPALQVGVSNINLNFLKMCNNRDINIDTFNFLLFMHFLAILTHLLIGKYMEKKKQEMKGEDEETTRFYVLFGG